MTVFEDEPHQPRSAHLIGEDLSLVSVEELQKRIALLHGEIERLEEELKRKGDSRSAAEAVFR